MAEQETISFAVLAEFEDVSSAVKAAKKVHEAGYTQWDLHSPFPIHGIDKAMGIPSSILPLLTLGGAIAGFTAAVFLTWWTNATSFDWAPSFLRGYPYLISGKPDWSFPANIPVLFEMTVLLSAFAAVLGMLGLNSLPMLYNPLFKSARFRRATDDRFFVVIETEDPQYDPEQTQAFLQSLGAVSIETVDD